MEQIEFLGLAATELERQKIPWMLVGSYAIKKCVDIKV